MSPYQKNIGSTCFRATVWGNASSVRTSEPAFSRHSEKVGKKVGKNTEVGKKVQTKSRENSSSRVLC